MSEVDGSREESPERLISFADVLSALGKYWQLLVGGALIGGFLAAMLAAFLPKYEASGFYYTPGWSLAEYKRFRSEFGSADAIGFYFSGSTAGNPEATALLVARSGAARFWETSVKPLYPITKKDAKEIFESNKDRDSSTIMGLELAIAGRPSDVARAAVITLGEYMTETLLVTALRNWISSSQAASNAELLKAENQLLQTRYSLEQTRKRIEELRSLQVKYPEAQRMVTRQVVSADPVSARYLAPISQVIALESGAAEMNESVRRMERRANQVKVEAAFFDRAALASREVRKGTVLLDKLTRIREEIISNVDQDDEAMREVANRFSLDLKGFRDQFSIGFGFRSAVLLPTRSIRSVTQFAGVGVMLGLLVGACFAGLLGWMAWWSREAGSARGARLSAPAALQGAE